MAEHSRYTAVDLQRLADDKGPFFADNARQALCWAARVLDAADAAVQAERKRAEAAERELAAPKLLDALLTAEALLYAHDKPIDPAITAALVAAGARAA